MPMHQGMNKEVYWMSFRDETVFFNLALLLILNLDLTKVDEITDLLCLFLDSEPRKIYWTSLF